MTSTYNPGVHRFAKFVVAWTVLLFIAGALVTSNDAALSVPDWPKSFGTWFPSLRMLAGGAFFEHSHRVIAGCLGIFTLALAILIWMKDSRRWLRWFGFIAVAGIAVQAVLGGEVVRQLLHYWLPVIHACFAQIVFGALLAIAVFTSRWWVTEHPQLADTGSPSIHTVAIANAEVIFLQVVLGAGFRHQEIPVWPHIARGVCGYGHGDLDRDCAAQAVWGVAGTFACADSTARDIWHSVFAGSRSLLVANRYRGSGATYAGDGVVDGHPYRGGCVVVRVFGVHCFDLLPDRSARQGSCRRGAAAGGCLVSTARTTELALGSRANAYVALTKPDVSFLVLMTTAAGYYMGARGPVNWLNMVQTVFATMLIAAGTAALNHYIERESDRYMRRTASRPLPSGVLQPGEALAFGVALSVAGALDLYLTAGPLAAGLGVATCLSYLLAYTPLKKRTVWATFVGAFPGAIPPMIGWVAASGSLDRGAWMLFGILFFWQFPHFHAIAWMYREDYARAGILMLPVVDPEGKRTFRQIILTARR